MRTHAEFIEELRASEEAVERVAAWLCHTRGAPVVRRPTFETPTISARAEYADNGDLEILLRVEVKHRSEAFTSKADFPFDLAIVDAVPNFDKKRPTPFAYVILNKAMDAGLYVDVARTRSEWTRVELFDGRNKVRQPFYVCPKELFVDVAL